MFRKFVKNDKLLRRRKISLKKFNKILLTLSNFAVII
jgi:hypothetical protein